MRLSCSPVLATSLALAAFAAPLDPVLAQEAAAARTDCPATEDHAAAPVEQPKKKRKGLGLGGLLSAARQAGLGDVLSSRTGGMFGGSKLGSIAGSVAGTAINAAEGGQADEHGLAGSVMGSSTAGQIAGAVTGTAIELAARSGVGDATPTCAN